MTRPRLTHLPAVFSLLSLVASGYAVFWTKRTVPSPPAGACACDDASTRRELDELRRGVAVALGPRAGGAREAPEDLAARLTALQVDVDRLRASAMEIAPDGAVASQAQPGPRRLVEFRVPSAAVSVRQLPDGSIAATNTDPSLTGRVMSVDATAEDGTAQRLTITVPGPGQ